MSTPTGPSAPPEIRPARPEEFAALYRALEFAFGDEPRDEDLAVERGVFEFDRSLGVFEDGRPVATAAAFSRELTAPGGPVPAACVTWVSVAPTHRRRGLLRQVMRRQLDDVRAAGREAIAVLWASEAAIYGRFGYGSANRHVRLSVPARRVRVRPDLLPADGRVRLGSTVDDRATLESVYEGVRATRPGHLDRRGGWWDRRLHDPEHWREGATSLALAVREDAEGVADGYAIYRLSRPWAATGAGEVKVHELVAATPAAHAALWDFLLGTDLMTTVTYSFTALDDPLPHLVPDLDPVAGELIGGLWVRLVDLPRALSARTYGSEVEVVLDVRDDFCPWNAGRYRLAAGPGGAECSPTTDPAELSLSATELGAAYLGGTTLAALAAAGRVAEHREGALAAASRAFAGDRAPVCPEIF